MTQFALIKDILVSPKRQRKTFDPVALAELRESIQDNTLLQAPVIRKTPAGLELVAGERRLRALTDLHDLGIEVRHNNQAVPAGQAPYTDIGDLSPLQAWEAELEENIRRADLTWQERAAATAELMALRKAQAEETGSAPPTVAQITEEVRPGQTPNTAHDTTRQELIVSRHLGDPEVAAAPTVKEAFKILKKREERENNAALAVAAGATFSSKSHTILNTNCVDWMRSQPGGQFEIILTDPPYGMGADSFGDSGAGVSANAHFYDDSPENWLKLMLEFVPVAYRLATENAHAYLFCDLDKFHALREMMSDAGWRVFRTPLVWNNPDGFRAPWPDKGPQRQYELILFAVKGDKRVNHLAPDVLTYKKDRGIPHPAAKPVSLLDDLLRRSAKPGDRVLDAFAGSGQTVVACNALKLACTAIEQDPSSYGFITKQVGSLSAHDEGLF